MAHVQHRSQRVGSGNNVLAYTTSNALGNLLYAYVMIEDTTSTITSVSDTANGAWTAIGSIKRHDNGQFSLQLFYRKNCAAGANTVTVVLSAGSSTIGITELSGYDTAAPLGQHIETQGIADSVDSGNMPSTTTANELIVAAVVSNRVLTVGSGFTLRVFEDFNAQSLTEEKVAVSIGAYNATAAMNVSGSFIVCVATFKLAGGGGGGGTPTPPVTHRDPIAEPAPQTWGAAGQIQIDPSFGTEVLRVTDANTMPSVVGASFGTPSASHQNAWQSDSRGFYVRGSATSCLPFTFDPTTMVATRRAGTGDAGGLIVTTGCEPNFSWVDPNVIYVAGVDGTSSPYFWPTIEKFTLGANTYTTLLNLGTVAHVDAGRKSWWYPVESTGQRPYCGSIFSSEGAVEKVLAISGGDAQDHHNLCYVFNAANPAICTVVDTKNSLIYINGAVGVATSSPLGFLLHHAQIDRSGKWATLEVTSGDFALGKSAKYIWNLALNTFTALEPFGNAHTCMGFENFINQDGPDGTPYDNAKFSLRDLDDLSNPRSLIRDPQPVGEIYWDGHTSWNNARAGSLQPVLAEGYRAQDGPNDSPHNNAPFRAWDNEIIAIETENSGPTTTVWRQCHHHSLILDDLNTANYQPFYFQPRVNVSPNGRFALFTTNQGKTLGNQASPEANNIKRYDAFMVKLVMTQPADVPPDEVPETPPAPGVADSSLTLPCGVHPIGKVSVDCYEGEDVTWVFEMNDPRVTSMAGWTIKLVLKSQGRGPVVIGPLTCSVTSTLTCQVSFRTDVDPGTYTYSLRRENAGFTWQLAQGAVTIRDSASV